MTLSRGGRNLLILGIGASLITLVTTAASIAIYHYSGDIYLDRSRPGFLPDEQEEQSEQQRQASKYTFPDSGPVDVDALNEYLTEVQPVTDVVTQLSDPFSADPLSDETLAIPKKP